MRNGNAGLKHRRGKTFGGVQVPEKRGGNWGKKRKQKEKELSLKYPEFQSSRIGKARNEVIHEQKGGRAAGRGAAKLLKKELNGISSFFRKRKKSIGHDHIFLNQRRRASSIL